MGTLEGRPGPGPDAHLNGVMALRPAGGSLRWTAEIVSPRNSRRFDCKCERSARVLTKTETLGANSGEAHLHAAVVQTDLAHPRHPGRDA